MQFNVKNKSFIYLLLLPSIAIILGGISLYIVEQRVDEPSIKNMGDAFWLAITTITTVGYGDVYPSTLEGRIVSGVLLLVGVLTIFGFLTTIGAKIIEPMLEVKNKQKDGKNLEKKEKFKISSNDKSDIPYVNNDEKIDNNKEWLKNQIENLQKLDDNDFVFFISRLVDYYQNSKNKEKDA